MCSYVACNKHLVNHMPHKSFSAHPRDRPKIFVYLQEKRRPPQHIYFKCGAHTTAPSSAALSPKSNKCSFWWQIMCACCVLAVIVSSGLALILLLTESEDVSTSAELSTQFSSRISPSPPNMQLHNATMAPMLPPPPANPGLGLWARGMLFDYRGSKTSSAVIETWHAVEGNIDQILEAQSWHRILVDDGSTYDSAVMGAHPPDACSWVSSDGSLVQSCLSACVSGEQWVTTCVVELPTLENRGFEFMAHERFHAWQAQVLGVDMAGAPQWWVEGMADLFEAAWQWTRGPAFNFTYAYKMCYADTVNMTELEETYTTRTGTITQIIFCWYLLDVHGYETLETYMLHATTGDDWLAAFEATYSTPPHEAYRAFNERRAANVTVCIDLEARADALLNAVSLAATRLPNAAGMDATSLATAAQVAAAHAEATHS